MSLLAVRSCAILIAAILLFGAAAVKGEPQDASERVSLAEFFAELPETAAKMEDKLDRILVALEGRQTDAESYSTVNRLLAELESLKEKVEILSRQNDLLTNQVEGLLSSREEPPVDKAKPPVDTTKPPVDKAKSQDVLWRLPDPRLPIPPPTPTLKHFSLLGLNIGADHEGNLTWSGKGRYFRPISDELAFQAEGEYMDWDRGKESQFDFGMVGRRRGLQLGLFGSFKYVRLPQFDGGGTMGQASLTVDYLFPGGKVGLFGSKGFLGRSLVHSRALSESGNVIENTYLRTVDQISATSAFALWGNAWAEGNIGYLRGHLTPSRAGGTLRLIIPFKSHWAFTAEGGVNETLLSQDNYGRFAAGIRFGNFLAPQEYSKVKHPVPASIPRVRYEIITEVVGNDTPVCKTGPDLVGVSAGRVELNGSGSFDPNGDQLTFAWSRLSGPPVVIHDADSARASFVAAAGHVYSFKLEVSDQKSSASCSLAVTAKQPPPLKIVHFTATPHRIKAGEKTTLSWQVVNADEAEIQDLVVLDPDNFNGSREEMPERTAIYTLIARRGEEEVSQTVQVTVDTEASRPSFVRCDVTPQNIRGGDSATIAWETTNADTVMFAGVGTVPKTGSLDVKPAENTAYTLTAKNEHGSVSCPLRVQVTPGAAPVIITFIANPDLIPKPGAALNPDPKQEPEPVRTPARLHWQVENATEVTISPGVGVVDNTVGSVSVSPTMNEVYTLTAKNRHGRATASAGVTVIQPVEIIKFEAPVRNSDGPGDTIILSWVVKHADEVVISDLGSRPSSGSVPIRITDKPKNYTIIARNRFFSAESTLKVVAAREANVYVPLFADAGLDRWIVDPQETEVQLHGDSGGGSGSLNLSHVWRVAVGNAIIDDPTLLDPTVTLLPPHDTFVFELRVIDNKTREEATSTVTVRRPPPDPD